MRWDASIMRLDRAMSRIQVLVQRVSYTEVESIGQDHSIYRNTHLRAAPARNHVDHGLCL